MSISNNSQDLDCTKTIFPPTLNFHNASSMQSKYQPTENEADYERMLEETVRLLRISKRESEAVRTAKYKLLFLLEKNYSPAEYVLGTVYLLLGTDNSRIEGMRWIERAAFNGYGIAQSDLGTVYLLGIGGKSQSRAIALMLYELAAAQECRDGQYNLGMFYLRGDKAERNYVLAAKWLRQAALQGHLVAQFQIGLMYEHGLGLQTNCQASFYWIKKAADAGYLIAQLELINRAAHTNSAEFNAELISKDAAMY